MINKKKRMMRLNTEHITVEADLRDGAMKGLS